MVWTSHRISIQSITNGKWVSSETGKLVACKEHIGNFEQFSVHDVHDLTVPSLAKIKAGEQFIALKAYNGKYVCAEDKGRKNLVANRSKIGEWEPFRAVPLGGTMYAFQAKINGQFVCAEGGGSKPLVANKPHVHNWETFQVFHKGKNRINLKSMANHRYVCAEKDGGNYLIANKEVARVCE